MKIAIVSRSWFTHAQGGAERYLYEVTKEFLKRGHLVTTISLHSSDLPNRHIATKLPRIPVLTSALNSLVSGLLVNAGSYDVAIVNGYWAELCPLVLTKPCVVVSHDVGLFRSSFAKNQKLKYLFRRVVLRNALRKAARVVVPSRLTLNDIKRYLDIDERKLSLVVEGIDLERFKPQRLEPERAYGIFQFGRLAPNKGQHLTIRGFRTARKRYRNMVLSIVGHLSENRLNYYKHLLSLAEGDENIAFRTNVSDEELVNCYGRADLCVYPSIAEEGWGITVTEAFACRVPVICSRIFFETGVADRTRAVLCRTDPKDIAEKITWAFDHPDEMKVLAERGYAFARGLSWGGTSERILEVIKEVLGKKQPGGLVP